MSVRFFDFSRYHGKNPQGSTNIRVNQLIKYWDEAELYKYGENPDVLIFQKVYATPDYEFPKHFGGIKILDVCDPDWFDEALIVETCNAMDAVTVPTKALQEFISQFHDNVIIVPDRFDLEPIPRPIKHIQEAKTVIWFGYSHNAILLKPAMRLLDELNLNLILVANDDPFPHLWSQRNHEDYYTYVKYDEATIYDEIQKAGFAILPEGNRPVDRYKSNNKTIKANLAGLPVAKDSDEVKLYMDARARQDWFDNNYANIQVEYDVHKSIEQYKVIIKQISDRSVNGKS